MKKTPGLNFRTPVVATDLRYGRETSRLVGGNGEVNASSKMDLARQIAKLMEMATTNEVVTEDEYTRRSEIARTHTDLVMAAFQSDAAHKEVGAAIADDLYAAANREGFMRRMLGRLDLSQGNIPRVKMRMKNTVATAAGAPVQVRSQIARDNTYYPPEFYIQSRVFVEEREIQQSISDVLQEKFVEAQEGLMVVEDRTWYAMATATVGIDNDFTTIVGTMNPTALGALKTKVTQWNIPADKWLIATDIWTDIVGDTQFAGIIDPVSKHELLLTGQLGTILGMTVLTDAFRHPQHKVLNRGEMFIVGDEINHGIYTDRGGVTSVPTDVSHEMVPGRGWALAELMSMVIANSRSVAKGRRV